MGTQRNEDIITLRELLLIVLYSMCSVGSILVGSFGSCALFHAVVNSGYSGVPAMMQIYFEQCTSLVCAMHWRMQYHVIICLFFFKDSRSSVMPHSDSSGSVCTIDHSARLDLSSLDPVVRQPDIATSLGLIATFVSVRCLVYPLPSLHVNAFYLTLCPSYFKRVLLQIQLRAIWQPFAMHKYLFRWEILGLETCLS